MADNVTPLLQPDWRFDHGCELAETVLEYCGEDTSILYAVAILLNFEVISRRPRCAGNLELAVREAAMLATGYNPEDGEPCDDDTEAPSA